MMVQRRVSLILFAGLLLGGCRSELSLERCGSDGSCDRGYICEYEWHGRHYCILSRDMSIADASRADPDAADGARLPLDSAIPDTGRDGPDAGVSVDVGPVDAAPEADLRPDMCTPSGEVEECNGADDDCDGITDELLIRDCIDGFSYEDLIGPGCTTEQTCNAGVWADCGLAPPERNPDGTAEICDGKDNDCDGTVDEGSSTNCYQGPGGEVLEGDPEIGACGYGLQQCLALPLERATGQALQDGVCVGAVGATPEACDDNIDDTNCNEIDDDRCTCSNVEVIRSDRISLCRGAPEHPIAVRTADSHDALGASCHENDRLEQVDGMVREPRNGNEAYREKIFHFLPPAAGNYEFRLTDKEEVASNWRTRRDPVLALRAICEDSDAEIGCDDDGGPGKDSILAVQLDRDNVDAGIYIIAQGWWPGRDEQPMDLFIRRMAMDCGIEGTP